MRVTKHRWRSGLGIAGLLWLCFCMAGHASAESPAAEAQPINFGILPIGSAGESREQWRPLLDDLAARLGHPVQRVSVSNYAGLSSAIGAQQVDIAFVSGRLAIDAVSHQHMSVVAQFVRSDGARGNVGLLIVRGDGPIHDLKGLLASPGRWRYARGEPLSVTGYVAPEAGVFAPRGLNSDTFFTSVRVDNHQNNALAVVNDEVDVATSNNPDLDLFTRKFPQEAAQLKVIWRSSLIPAGVLVVRDGMPEPLRSKLIAFVRTYGSAPGAAGERERANMARIPDLAGFATADNHVLQPFIDMEFTLLKQRALHGQWVSEQAKQTKLAQLELDYQQVSQLLKPH